MLQLLGHKGTVRCVAFAPNGCHVASGGDDGTTRIWDVMTTQCLQTFPRTDHRVFSVAYHPNGEELVSGYGSPYNNIHFWNLTEPTQSVDHESLRERIWEMVLGTDDLEFSWLNIRDNLTYVRYIPPGNTLLLTTNTAQAFSTGGSISCLPITLSPEASSRIASTTTKSWLDNRSQVCAIALSGYGEIAAVASKQYVRMGRWDAAQVPPAYAAQQSVTALALNHEGTRLAGSFQNRVTVWEPDGAEIHEYAGHDDTITALAFRPDGAAVASASLDQSVRVWSPDTGEILARYDWGLGSIHALEFSPDGALLAVAGDGGLIVCDAE
ncbi:MAG: hypothetical protein LC104_07400 [Bacteroidales bacterium]|nr:hypothetical protein [Bacteroidales bacterium]